MKFKNEVENRINEVINNKKGYPTNYLDNIFDIDRKCISDLRNGKRKLKNLHYATILKILDAYGNEK